VKNPITATLNGLWQMRPGAAEAELPGIDDRLDGRLALVTGANRGLGRAIAVALAKRGARLVLACRSGVPAIAGEIARETGSASVEAREVDMADLDSVSRLVASLAADGVRLDLAVLNAGIVPAGARPTAQGFELMFGVNFLANVALVEGLLESGVLVPSATAPPRVVFVTSESHRGAGPIDLAGLGVFREFNAMGGMRVYGYSKLLLSAYAAQLARRLGEAASVHACCPGPINSDIAREAPAWLRPLLAPAMAAFFRSPESAAVPVVWLAVSRALDDRTGTYFHVREEKQPDDECLDEAKGEALLRRSIELIAHGPGAGAAPRTSR
jgi:NAD(P)-dependent dehydrogenase (short-subunit alcohol dehydrogenase family)